MFRYVQELLILREERRKIAYEARLNWAKAEHELAKAGHVGTALAPGYSWVNQYGVHQTAFASGGQASSPQSGGAAMVDPTYDIVEECTEPQRAVRIVSGQRQGKTWVAMHIACRWLAEGRQVIVIGPKRNRGEWAGCVRYIGDADTMLAGLETVHQMALERMQSGERMGINGEERPPVLCVLDDWLTVCAQLRGNDLPQRFVEAATVIMASQNISAVFCIHADTSAAMNVDKIGSALKDDTLGIFVHKQGSSRSAPRAYGIVENPSEKPRRVQGTLIYPDYGFIPAGKPEWPRGPERGPAPRTGQNRKNYPGNCCDHSDAVNWSAETVRELLDATEMAQFALPKPPPRVVDVRTDRGAWKRLRLTVTAAHSIRQAWRERPTFNHVIKHSFLAEMKGSKTTKINTIKALLGLPSDDYRVIES